ncbi:DoxX family membrane protein [Spirosoma sp. HMF4905]|uniref:DoxX family membrane protein n=1 Tax=Spirosoma arboris TaxID=2682092 RepID=A0A7K1S9V9_9BACT|nr:DoxX family membrane protein [Spirosoma arboris]MVM30561.1 DoxX family membrane protein [Spirosoma arboris]
MAFFLGLLSIGSILYGIGWLTQAPYLLNPHHDALLATTVMFVMIGLTHLRKPEQLTYMIPKFLPNARLLVLLSGVAELVLGIGLLISETRFWSAWGLIILLIVIFPANINVAVNNLPPPGGLPAKPWYVWSRLLFQPVYIIWIWYAALA